MAPGRPGPRRRPHVKPGGILRTGRGPVGCESRTPLSTGSAGFPVKTHHLSPQPPPCPRADAPAPDRTAARQDHRATCAAGGRGHRRYPDCRDSCQPVIRPVLACMNASKAQVSRPLGESGRAGRRSLGRARGDICERTGSKRRGARTRPPRGGAPVRRAAAAQHLNMARTRRAKISDFGAGAGAGFGVGAGRLASSCRFAHTYPSASRPESNTVRARTTVRRQTGSAVPGVRSGRPGVPERGSVDQRATRSSGAWTTRSSARQTA